MIVDIRVYKLEQCVMRLGGTAVESIERIVRLEERIGKLEETMEEEEYMRETWLEKNVSAEGEVTILRERVDQQDRTIRRLEDKLDRVTKILQLRSELERGKYFSFY
jgi:predicted nuclease with TOPRIM domain